MQHMGRTLADKSAATAFFLGATVALPGEVFSSLERLRTFLLIFMTAGERRSGKIESQKNRG